MGRESSPSVPRPFFEEIAAAVVLWAGWMDSFKLIWFAKQYILKRTHCSA
jgi:hypothetical protein